jgi:hypothetical protein
MDTEDAELRSQGRNSRLTPSTRQGADHFVEKDIKWSGNLLVHADDLTTEG